MNRALLLDSKQRSYIATLLSLNLNWKAACRASNVPYSTARKWLKQPDFQAELARRQEILSAAANVTAAEVIGLLASQLRADIADVLPDEPIVMAARERGVSHLIQQIEITTTTRADGSEEKKVKLKMVDAGKAAAQLSKLMGLEMRDDLKERARTAIRTLMDLEQCSSEEAILSLAPHYPIVAQLRDEFAGKPVIEIKPKKGD